MFTGQKAKNTIVNLKIKTTISNLFNFKNQKSDKSTKKILRTYIVIR